MKWFCYAMLTVCLIAGLLQAPACEASYCNEKTYLFFGNGMFNEQSEAATSKDNFEVRLRSAGNLSDDEWVFELSYNHDEGLFSLYEVFRQRMGDQAGYYWRMLGSLDLAPDWFQEAAQGVAAGIDRAEALVDADLRRHVQRYQGLLLSGNRVLVVAHSQGNLYANAAHAALAGDSRMPMDAFGIVAVATPASHVAGDGPYYTLMYDLVIASVRGAFPTTLPGNVVNGVSDRDWKHHSFIDSYLGGDQTGPLIVDSALSRANALSWPTPQVGQGPISVTLTWGEQPDVDLHVFEPNGSHVYYAAPQGASGFLDYDDARSYGPEHYYVAGCDLLETGRYWVAVNYYRGSAPETAQVQIQAGDLVRDYSVYLPMAYGSTGNFRSWSVASIEVLGDAAQGYSFKVQQ